MIPFLYICLNQTIQLNRFTTERNLTLRRYLIVQVRQMEDTQPSTTLLTLDESASLGTHLPIECLLQDAYLAIEDAKNLLYPLIAKRGATYRNYLRLKEEEEVWEYDMFRGFKETQRKEFLKSLEDAENAFHTAWTEKQEAERILEDAQIHLESLLEIQAILEPFWQTLM